MAGPRIVVFRPNLCSLVKACQPTTYCSIRPQSTTSNNGTSYFHSFTCRKQETYQQRYGNAAEPQLPPPPPPPLKVDVRPVSQGTPKKDTSTSSNTHQDHKETSPDLVCSKKATQDTGNGQVPSSPDSRNVSTQKEAIGTREEPPVTPLDIVLQAWRPSNVHGEQHKHPHLAPSPYEHHFDTYSLVQDLAKGGFTEDQAVTIMKAIRLMLSVNLDIAKDGLVSKSDVENETYLFRAACSELRTSLQSSRHSEVQRQRTQRAQLHHEYDILNQRVTQDMLTLREELKAMFNDRKMAVQEEKQRMDSKISELNYEITVLLNSDSKSEVEGLRWVLTRRAALAIAIAALMTLISLNYSSYLMRERDEAEKRLAAAKKMAAQRDETRSTNPVRDQGTQTTSSLAESLG